MRNHASLVLFVLTASSAALAEEATASTSASGSGPSAFGAGVGQDDGFAAPNGQLGAGLSISRSQVLRAYAELGFARAGEEFFETDVTVTSLSLIVGGGYKVTSEVELEAMLPFAFGALGVDPDPGDVGGSGFAVGNLHLGANYVRTLQPALRVKVGGAIEWGPWTIDPSQGFNRALAYAVPGHAAHDVGLWAPETIGIVTPSHIEYGRQIVFTGDGGLGLYVPTNGGDTEFAIQLDPGVGVYATPTVLVGARIPFVWMLTEGGDGATQFAFEPYGRFDVADHAFLNVRLTLNIDDPYGFAFDEGKFWGLHVGGGGTF